MSYIFRHPIFKIFSSPRNHHHLIQHGQIRQLNLFRRKSGLKEMSPYIIVRAKKEDFNEILKVMHASYYDGEPTIMSLNIKPNSVLDELTLRALAEGFTLVAKCKYNGNIVGACINQSVSPWDPDMDEKLACAVKHEQTRKLIMFCAYMTRAPDLYRCLGVSKIYEMAYLFVKRAHRKKGLAFKLLEESKTLGADAGFPVIRCDATSAHTAKICEKLGMQKVADIPYCTYLDQSLQPIFQPPWPHQSVQIFCDCASQHSELKKKIQKKGNFFKFSKTSKPKQPHV